MPNRDIFKQPVMVGALLLFGVVVVFSTTRIVTTHIDLDAAKAKRLHEKEMSEERAKDRALDIEKLEWEKYQAGFKSELGVKPGCNEKGQCNK